MVQDSKYYDNPKMKFNYFANKNTTLPLEIQMNFLSMKLFYSNSTNINGYPAFEFTLKGNLDIRKETWNKKRSVYPII